jgi:hypothetical protein
MPPARGIIPGQSKNFSAAHHAAQEPFQVAANAALRLE